MDAVHQSLVILYSPQSRPDQVNRANEILLAFRSHPDALALSVQTLERTEQVGDPLLLHFAASCVYDLFKASISVAQARSLLAVLSGRFNRPRHAQLAQALQRACGKVVALMTSAEWSTCLGECLEFLEGKGDSGLSYGVLQQTAEHVERLLVGKAASLVVAQMQHAAPTVCSWISLLPVLSTEALGALEAWIRLGAVPVAVLVRSRLVERLVETLSSPNQRLAEAAVQVLAEEFTAPVVASFRTARSVARTSLSLDVPEQFVLVKQTAKELLRLNGAGQPVSVARATLLCDIVRQHISLLTFSESELQKPLLEFLLSLLGSSVELAAPTLSVWVRLEEAVSSSNSSSIWPSVFGRVVALALRSAASRCGNKDEDALRQWRAQLQDTVLSGAQVSFQEIERVFLLFSVA